MSDVDEKMFLEAETAFGLNFLQTLPLNESLVFSPLSIAFALSLVHSGAKNVSRDQIGDVILKGANDDQLVNHFSFISEGLEGAQNGVKVSVANRVFVKKDVSLNPDYLKTVEKNFHAGAESVDFGTPTAAQKVNDFVKQKTGGKINGLVTEDSVKDAVALLVNAIYFKGEWREDFSDYSTREDNFTLSSGALKKVPFMTEWSSDRHYSSDDLFQVLSLPYTDPAYQFAIFLPKVKNGLNSALKQLNAARLQKLLSQSTLTFMNTAIPKFTIEKEFELKNILEKLGVKQIFTDQADLSGIAKGIKISDGAHKALIEVNEKGTTAAAATSVKAVPMSLRMDEPVEFKANHPFLFALVRENHPIFLGVFQG